MTSQHQRFCPLCDRPFVDGEAVLRCQGCGVLHHPGCWVKHNGCATTEEHVMTPAALAYSNGPTPAGQAPHPGEGTRLVRPPGSRPQEDAPPPPLQLASRMRRGGARPAAETEPASAADEEAVIGESRGPLPAAKPRAPYNPTPAPPATPVKRSPTIRPDGQRAPAPLPRIYSRHRYLGYWYIPVAVLLAGVVAMGVIWGVDQLAGGEEQAAGPTPVPSPVLPTRPAATPAAATASTPQPGGASPTPTTASQPGSSQKFRPGDVAVVAGTGECLNVRVAAGRSNDAIVCLADGDQVTITGGPEAKDNLQWWKVKTKSGEGWAAEDYLAKKP